MNAGPHHSKVRVTLALADNVFVAGQEVCGKMSVECRSDKSVGIGTISVDLHGVQGVSKS
jgi:hypothetical protein